MDRHQCVNGPLRESGRLVSAVRRFQINALCFVFGGLPSRPHRRRPYLNISEHGCSLADGPPIDAGMRVETVTRGISLVCIRVYFMGNNS